jgi:hypothetical protein
LFSSFKKKPNSPFEFEKDEFGKPLINPLSFNFDDFNLTFGDWEQNKNKLLANYRVPDYQLTEEEKKRRDYFARTGKIDAINTSVLTGLLTADEASDAVKELINNPTNKSESPNIWKTKAQLEDALKNRRSELDKYRLKDKSLRLQ